MLFYLWNILAQNGLDDVVRRSSDKKPMLELSDILIIALMMVVVFIVMRSARNRTVASRGKSKGKAKEIVNNRLSENPNVSINRLQELMAALSDMSREISGQIDTRTAKLEILLAKADNQIAEYERKIAKLEAQNAMASLAANKPVIEDLQSSISVSEEVDDNSSESDSFENIAENAKSEEIPPDGNLAQNEASGHTMPQNGINAQIIKLARDGISLSEISRATGRPSGEIELILNLNGIKID